MNADYLQFEPSARCRPYVETIWVQESAADTFAPPTTILPSGRIELVVHYGDPFSLMTDGGCRLMPIGHIVGPQREPFSVRSSGKTGIVIVRFRPWSAAALFAIPPSELDEQIVAADQIWPTETVDALCEQVQRAHTPIARAMAIDAFIGNAIDQSTPDPACQVAIRRMNETWGSMSIQSLADSLGISRRQLGRRFIAATGTSPKRMSRILRAQKAVSCFRAGWQTHDVIDRCRYADQSHLIHDVVSHSGKRPSQLRNLTKTHLQRHYNSTRTSDFCGEAYL